MEHVQLEMNDKDLLDNPQYRPNKMLDEVIKRFGLKNDSALCRALRVGPPSISKVRSRVQPVSASLLLRLHDATGIPVPELRELMGVRSKIDPLPLPQQQ